MKIHHILLITCLWCLQVYSSFAQTLVWEDNFNGTAIDGNKWTFDFGDGCERGLCGWGNNELQYYTSRSENARIENGNLVLEARRENFLTREFTSARLKTEGRVHFRYGTLEARIRIPNLQNGLWPAFWMLGTTGTWPANGEIDIMEMGNAAAISAGVINRRVGAAVHWDYQGSQADYSQDHTSTSDLHNDYHLYKLTWDPQFIRIYIDNIQYFVFDISNVSANSLEEFHNPHYILLNLAVGGTYTGITSASGITAPLPGRMYIDYIRLYQNSGSTLYLGSNNALTGTFGVYTETTPVNSRLTYGTDANLYLWNNLTPISATPYEGSQVLAYRATAGAWFGMGIATDHKNMSNFANGHLRFHMRTTATHTFKIGISTAFGDSWIDFVNGGQQYGLVRDGSWREVSIPFSAFYNLDLYSVKQMFMLVADPPVANVDIFIDNIYYSGGGGTVNPPPTVSITSPANGGTFNQGQSITLNANASDSNGNVTLVEFYSNGAKIGEDATSPYSFTWTGAPSGTHTLTARATDNGGASTTSSGVSITVNSTTTLPSPWQTSDVGAVAATGSATHNAGTFTVRGSGADIWDTADEFRYVYQTLNGDGMITAQVNSLTNTNAWAKAGVMVRASLNANAAHAMTVITPSNGIAFQRRTSTGGTSANTSIAGQTAPRWVRVQRSGNTFTSSYSTNGTSWTTIGTATITMGTTAYVGLCVTSHNDGTLCTASFSNVSTSTTSTTLCSGTVANGDYRYEVSSTSGTVNWRFVPLSPIQGSTMALIYIRSGSGGYAGYPMTASGSDFIFSQSHANGSALSFYFTYRVGNTTIERNSSATPHSYTAGTTCNSSTARMATTLLEPLNGEEIIEVFPNPVESELHLRGASKASVKIIDIAGREMVQGELHNGVLDVSMLATGIYTVFIQHHGSLVSRRFVKK